jgi:quercetin dioxygenase-like cupin family protein
VNRETVWAVAAAMTAFVSAPAPILAFANTETEEERVSRALQSALEKHGGDVNRCFEKALADTLDVSGKVELAVDVGEEGKVTRAVPLEQSPTSPLLLSCLSESALGWTIPGVAAGSTVIVPLAFEGQMAQFSIKAADAPERGPGARKSKGPGAKPPFTVKILVDEATMRARQASLSLLTVASANRIAMHKHPGAEVLYIKKGRARVLGPKGVSPEVLPEGAAIFIPAGMPHAIENMVRTAPVEILQVFAPPGPERVYRDPHDAKGRAAFDIVRDLRKATAPEGTRLAVESLDKATIYAQPGKKIRVHLFFEPQSSDSTDVSLSIVELEPRTEVPRHTHEGSAEILYILQGSGEMHIGSEKLPFAADQAIHVPENQPHGLKVKGSDKTIALQIFAPAGPEQRWKGAPAPRAPTKPVGVEGGDGRPPKVAGVGGGVVRPGESVPKSIEGAASAPPTPRR